MLDRSIPRLLIRSIPTGTHGDGCDLKRFLYRGAAGNGVGGLDRRIAQGAFGAPLIERLDLMESLHAQIEGATISAISKSGLYRVLSLFVQWVDIQSADTCLTRGTAKALFVRYADHLQQRVRVVKNLKAASAYAMVTRLAQLLGPVIDPDAPLAHRALRDLTPLGSPKSLKRSRELHADKQRLDRTFEFGNFLADVCAGLSADAVRGPIPIEVSVADGARTLSLLKRKPHRNANPRVTSKTEKERTSRRRAALPPSADARDSRFAVINVRIRAELLIFIAQTGMNLAQAQHEPRAEYRWQTDDEDYIVRPVYKGRRQGVAKFFVFRAYRDHFSRYLTWLDALGLSKSDDRLFPLLYPVRIPPAHKLIPFDSIRAHCESLGIPFVGPRDLRRTRVNWLLRRSRDPDLTADMAAHTKATLLRVYEEGDLQSASQEIGAFHARTDPTLISPRTAPACLKGGDAPRPLPDTPEEAPQPDCVTPEGCLWCEHFRDVLAPDYCWRLATHRHLKSLEVALFHPPATQPIHPGYLVIDRLNGKLNAISARSAVCMKWVQEAKQRVREGSYHPRWVRLIEIMEDL